MTMQLVAGATTEDPRLDRVPFFDTRSRGFPIRALLPDALPLRSFGWACPRWLDQGREGACVGFAWSHELAAYPVHVPTTDETARDLYRQAQKVDEWPGEDYSGTSVLAGAKIVQDQGHMDEYRWAFGVEDALRAIGYFGPVVIGVNWYRSMFDPRPSGLLEVDRTAQPAGGHAILVRGVALKAQLKGEPSLPVVRLRNSWGRDWGRNGDCYLRIDDFEWLLDQGGECCIPVTRRHSPVADTEAMDDMGINA
jgi:hypothetical protein